MDIMKRKRSDHLFSTFIILQAPFILFYFFKKGDTF